MPHSSASSEWNLHIGYLFVKGNMPKRRKTGPAEISKGTLHLHRVSLGQRSFKPKTPNLKTQQKEKRNFWQIDFLLANENATVTTVVAAKTNEKSECKLNCHIIREGSAKILVKGFGASDCRENCGSHLLFYPDITEEPVLIQKIVKCYEVLGLAPLSYCACVLSMPT
jgi:Uri superfamily endonuclease